MNEGPNRLKIVVKHNKVLPALERTKQLLSTDSARASQDYRDFNKMVGARYKSARTKTRVF